MYKSYLKVAFRSFLKDRISTIVNLTGLSVGLAAVFMIMAYVMYELSFDRHYTNASRIYRIVTEQNRSNITQTSLAAPSTLGYTLKNEFPEIESVTNLQKTSKEFVINQKTVAIEVIIVDTSFLHIFNLPVLTGGANALQNDHDVLLTEKTARMLFPKQNPVGTLMYSDTKKVAFRIKGIIKDIPGNTHFTAGAVIARIPKLKPLDWTSYINNLANYILLKNGTDESLLSGKLSSIYGKYNFPKGTRLLLQPVTSIHLHSDLPDEPFANGSIKNVYIFSFTALLILITACINYINLATARSLQRLKETGVRKVLGASRQKLVLQFIIESVLFFVISVPVAFSIAALLWPVFTKATTIQAGTGYLLNIKLLLLAICTAILAGVLSGLYPTFIALKLKPVEILKGLQKNLSVNTGIRKVLIVFQFVISVVLIISTMVVYAQLHLLNNIYLGFNKENLIALPFQSFNHDAEAFKQALKKDKNIIGVSITGWNAGEHYGASSSMDTPSDSTKEWYFSFVDADFDFIKTLQVQLTEGRDFSYQFGSDMANIDSLLFAGNKKMQPNEWMDIMCKRPIIITEKTAEALQIKKPVVGKVLKYGALQGTIIGVAKDFNGISLLQKPSMVVLRAQQIKNNGNTYIRIAPQHIEQTISHIEAVWKQFFPGSVFTFSFVDERLQQLYSSQQKLASVFNTFAIIAILIAALGLFSLLAITVQQKTKEIGIRKVLGASVTQIVKLLSADFLKLVFIAVIIASPAAWWLMNTWLQDYAYRISLSWWMFAAAGVMAVLIAIAAISFQAIKAAVANPVNSLRTE